MDAIIIAGSVLLALLLGIAYVQYLSKMLMQNKENIVSIIDERHSHERELSAAELESKKSLIDQTLIEVKAKLGEFEEDRRKQYESIAKSLYATNENTIRLHETTEKLKSVLADPQTRGQWGERMADDVLRYAGFKEGINFKKNTRIESVGSIPDFTFLLPQGQSLNMDVKFPIKNYVKFMESKSQASREDSVKAFLNDVKSKIKNLAGRDYINPEQKTLDYVLMFIPNEQIYAFIHERDQQILDDALRMKVIFCSPLTLFAVLAVVRQATENFNLSQSFAQIQDELRNFENQWKKYIDQCGTVQNHIGRLSNSFDELMGVRKRTLEKSLSTIEKLKSEQDAQSDFLKADQKVYDQNISIEDRSSAEK